MGDVILIPNNIKTDLEGLAEELASKMKLVLAETANGLNKFSSVYEKRREAGGRIFYQLLCYHDQNPLQISEEKARQLIVEKLDAGDFEERFLVEHNGMQVGVLRKRPGSYLFTPNNAFVEKAGSYPYEIPSEQMQDAVRKIIS